MYDVSTCFILKESCFLNKCLLLYMVSLEQYATKTSCIYTKAVQMEVSSSGDKKHLQCFSRARPFSFPIERGVLYFCICGLPQALFLLGKFNSYKFSNYKDQEQHEFRKNQTLKTHILTRPEKKVISIQGISVFGFFNLFINHRKKAFVSRVSTES